MPYFQMTEEDYYIQPEDYVVKPEDEEFEHEILDLGKFLEELSYPTNRKEILEQAKKKGFPNEVMQYLKILEDVKYYSSVQVMRQIGS